MTDRFDLEQQILDCWGVTDDIQTIINELEHLNEDEVYNVLIGLKQLYNSKFRQTFNTFEELIRDRQI